VWDEGHFLSLLLCTSSTSLSIAPVRRVDGKATEESAAEARNARRAGTGADS
jgi:hypothetical protein